MSQKEADLQKQIEALRAENEALKTKGFGGKKIIVRHSPKTPGFVQVMIQGYKGVSPKPISLNPVGLAMLVSDDVVQTARRFLTKEALIDAKGDATDKARAIVAQIQTDRAARAS